MHHPGIPMSIYDIPQYITTAFQHSMTPINIASGFRKSGIFPFNRDIFTEDDFLSSSVTDRPINTKHSKSFVTISAKPLL